LGHWGMGALEHWGTGALEHCSIAALDGQLQTRHQPVFGKTFIVSRPRALHVSPSTRHPMCAPLRGIGPERSGMDLRTTWAEMRGMETTVALPQRSDWLGPAGTGSPKIHHCNAIRHRKFLLFAGLNPFCLCSAEPLQISLGNQPFDVSLPDVELTVLA